MIPKKKFYTELAYVLGIITLALGTALMERADYGMSMVVAPAYLLHLKISQFLPFFTFGTAEYTLQAFLLLITALVMGRFKLSYLFSFVTAVFYAACLDTSMMAVKLLPAAGTPARLALFLIGQIFCAVGVSLLFHTYIAPEAYEFFVKELSPKLDKNINIVKTIYDCTSCFVAICLSFAFFGMWHFEGVKLGTIFCALINGYTISLCSRLFESRFEFADSDHPIAHKLQAFMRAE